jgi:hypothetical protein
MKRALLIGINYIHTPQNRLNGCIDDIVDIKKVLMEQYQYQEENIVMLRDDVDIPSQQPTCANMLHELASIVSKSKDEDELWIHYSGHGSQIPDQFTFKESKLDDIIVPMDYQTGGFISDFQLYSFIRQIKGCAILVFDCCHSGTVCDLPWTFEFGIPNLINRVRTCPFVIDNQHIYMFSGCKDTETSADTYDYVHREPVGAFTCAFIACLEECAYTLPIMELYRKVSMRLYEQGFTQHPLFSSSHHEPSHMITRCV